METDMHVQKLADIRKQRQAAFEQLDALATKDDLTPDEIKAFGEKKAEVQAFDAQIERVQEAQALAAKSAKPVAGQTVPAQAEGDKYLTEKSLVVGGVIKMIGQGRGSVREARSIAQEIYGENHPVTKALVTGTGSAGGFIVPPDYMNEIIELLRAQAVVRAAGPRNIPMPRGTMTLPGQASAATASYAGEAQAISSSQQTLNDIVASFKKLTALVPVSNDMMRYADPAIDAFVRDDLVKVIALAEDYAFMFGVGTAYQPRGFLSFANGFASGNGGNAGNYLTGANSTAASGGNFITSNATYTLATVASELGGLVNKLDTANVPDIKRCWFMHPRSWNYLNNVQNSLGVYVYRDELSKGTLLGYPYKKSTQIPINIQNPSGVAGTSFVMLVEMTEAIVLDSMQLELSVSLEGTYIDTQGTTQSAFQKDLTLIRAVAEHDFHIRHDASVAVNQFVAWAPAIS
jgi:HK97 family phage major capsid protein